MRTGLLVPSSLGTAPTETQLVVFRSVFCCKSKVVGIEGQIMATALVPVLMIGKSGEPRCSQLSIALNRLTYAYEELDCS